MSMLTRDTANMHTSLFLESTFRRSRYRFLFTLDGVIAGFDTRPPTQDEFNDTALHIELTSDVGWVPHTFADSLAEEEDPIIDDVDEKKDYQFVSMALEGLGFQNSKTKDQQLHANPIGDSVPF